MSKTGKKWREKQRAAASAAKSAAAKKPKTTILKRKLERQEKRKAKKDGRKQFYLHKFVADSGKPAVAAVNSKQAAAGNDVMVKKKRARGQAGELEEEEDDHKKTQKKLKELEKQQQEQRRKQLLLANELEARNIKQLEKQLGLARRKSKNLPKSFQDDGLDYVINACESATIPGLEDSDSETEDRDQKKKMKKKGRKVEQDMSDDQSGEEEEEDNYDDDDDDIEQMMMGDDDSGEEEGEEEEIEGEEEEEEGGEDAEEGEGEAEEGEGEEEENATKKPEVWEDIYGRMRNRAGEVIKGEGPGVDQGGGGAPSKYIPPALRKAGGVDAAPDEAKRRNLARLAKAVKGLLNRLAESNLHGIAGELESLYRTNPRNDVNQTLTDLISQAIVLDVQTPERLVMEHVMLVAILHANVGTEVGAHVLQEMVQQFTTAYSSTDLVREEGKRLENLLLVVVYLYNFRLVGAKLIFDIFSKLTESFRPKDLDLILLGLRSAGFSLRKDDPGELKGFIVRVQARAADSEVKQVCEDSRVRFMLEILMAVKNNNVNKIPNYDPSHFEHLKKTVKSYLREGNYVTELKIGLTDLEQADTRGRWWIVGSAYTGALAGVKDPKKVGEKIAEDEEGQHSSKLLQLARKLRMNTDTRRNIFCLIMSSEDYLEAAERIIKLGTKNQMERDAMFVLVDCSLQERSFNPFYSQVAAKLATMDRKYRIATQFTLWDKIRLTGDMKPTQLDNLAQYISHLIREKGQSVSILRVVEFAEMTKPNVRLLRTIFCAVLLMPKQQEVAEIFQTVSEAPKLAVFREGVKLFLRHFLLKQKSKLPPETDFSLLVKRVQVAEQALNTAAAKLKL